MIYFKSHDNTNDTFSFEQPLSLQRLVSSDTIITSSEQPLTKFSFLIVTWSQTQI